MFLFINRYSLYSYAFSPAQHVYFNKFSAVKLCYSFNFVSFCIITTISLFCGTAEQLSLKTFTVSVCVCNSLINLLSSIYHSKAIFYDKL